MTAPIDNDPRIQEYAHPERLVTTQWLAEHLGTPGIVVVESDEDVLLYETGHIPGAVKIDWHTDLNDPDIREYIPGDKFADLLSSKGISKDTTVIIYGDKNNWWAAYAAWVFTIYGHEDVRLLDGGRGKWVAEGRELTTDVPAPVPGNYPTASRDDVTFRIFKEGVLNHIGQGPLVDIRSLPEYTGERLHIPDYPEEGVLRGGHIPTARNVPWATAVAEDGTYKTRAELEAIYQAGGLGLTSDDAIVTYCRIGERSSHTWFALHFLLGLQNVKNYDGSWTEWGNAVRVPIVKGEAAGALV
ncbi:sulfurtransferase [Rarobacter faecitabidus]|uniref:Sulfurtransferase n=1 Tax=Rarobacter faecitabidus TaxID=13243 RepID=A0A542ZUJ2_RARFA|nr:sulfurtransferase [Rarobacter faecitabidus]TQL64024.1 thiosulfate/3-mercaptopyruvate sulfurtransferase [Rarobacter faecitabidus]